MAKPIIASEDARPTSSIQRSVEIITSTRSALSIWAAAIQTTQPGREFASDMQVAARAIHESMESAEADGGDANGQDFFCARNLIRILDWALWNFIAGDVNVQPAAADLAATARLADARLGDLMLQFDVMARSAN